MWIYIRGTLLEYSIVLILVRDLKYAKFITLLPTPLGTFCRVALSDDSCVVLLSRMEVDVVGGVAGLSD